MFGLSDDTVGALAGTLWGWSTQAACRRRTRAASGSIPPIRSSHQVLALAQRADRLSAPSLPACRRLRHHPRPARRGRADRERRDGGAHRHRMGQGRSRRARLLKVDVLGLGMLSCLRRGFDLLRIHYGVRRATARRISGRTRDAPVYRMLSRADTIGVFQVESRAQMSMLPRLKPKDFYDLVIEVAIVRPGPIQGDMVHPYLRRRQGVEKVALSLALPRSRGARRIATGARQDPGRAAVPGAGDAHRDRRRRLHARRGRQAAPRHGDVPPGRHHPVFPRQVRRGHDAARLSPRLRRALLQPDRRLRRIRLSREPCRELRHSSSTPRPG